LGSGYGKLACFVRTAAPLVVTASLVAEPTPSKKEVLERAATYVDQQAELLPQLVAEERGSQTLRRRASGPSVAQVITTRADFGWVKLDGIVEAIGVRDVREADGQAVGRQRRLEQLLQQPHSTQVPLVQALLAESARYNLGPVTRTINVPMLGLYFFDRSFIVGVDYTLAKTPGNVKRFSDLAKADSISLVEFRETTKETAIRGERGKEMPSHGKAYIEHTTGRILMTEMTAQDTSLTATIYVTYKAEPGLPVLVPQEMREIYTMPRSDTRIDGRAKYGRFRQFQVTTTEKPKS